jgi:hypothetical protein
MILKAINAKILILNIEKNKFYFVPDGTSGYYWHYFAINMLSLAGQ